MDKFVSENTDVANNFEYKKENKDGKYIAIKTAKGEYDVRNRKDLINFGLESAYISFDLLEQYCKLFNEPQFEIRFLLDDRDIKLTSDKINFTVYKTDRLDMAAEGGVVKYGDYNMRARARNINISKNSNIHRPTPITSISFCRPGDIKCLIIKLCFENRCILDRDLFINKYGRADCKKMVYLKIVRDKNPYIIINPLIFELINEINDDIRHKGIKHKSIKHINSYYNVGTFYSKYGNYVKQLLLENEDIRILIRLIKEANLFKKYSIQEIIEHCIQHNYEELFIKVFIGSKPTNGIKPLEDFSDVCFSCKNLSNCIGQDTRDMSDEYISRLLLRYRNEYSKRCLSNVIKTKDLAVLLKKTIFAKFLVSYTTVVSIKSLLIHLGIIEKDYILHKNSGKYCPKKDIWRIKNDLLV